MITRLGSILSSTCDKDPSIIGLDAAESYGDIEVDVKDFSLFSFVINVVKGYNFLVKLKKVNFICPSRFHLLIFLRSR